MNQIEEYEERKKLRRSRFRWRILAVLAILVAGGMMLSRMAPEQGPHVARFDVDGVITSDLDRTKLLREIAENDQVEALLVRINSPGGTVTGSEELYDSLREVAESKPVVATMGDVAASGGYITALAADQVFAMSNTITGSVGVIFQSPNVHELMEKVGVQMVTVQSGALKAEPSPFKPVDPEAIAAEEVLVADSFDWFLGLVKERRDMGDNALSEIRLGGIFTGRMALERGLIDGLGGMDAAREWLASTHDVSSDLDLTPYAVPEYAPSPLDFLFGEDARAALDVLDLRARLAPGLWAIYR
jgi:protease-4